MSQGDVKQSGSVTWIEGWPEEVAHALADAYAAGWWDAVAAMRGLNPALPEDYRKRAAGAGSHNLHAR